MTSPLSLWISRQARGFWDNISWFGSIHSVSTNILRCRSIVGPHAIVMRLAHGNIRNINIGSWQELIDFLFTYIMWFSGRPTTLESVGVKRSLLHHIPTYLLIWWKAKGVNLIAGANRISLGSNGTPVHYKQLGTRVPVGHCLQVIDAWSLSVQSELGLVN